MIAFFLMFVSYEIFVNTVAFAAFAEDKRRSEAGAWRISEANLLMLAGIGGWPGAKLGQKRFRHKTRKQPFATFLNCIGYLQAGTVLLALFTSQLDLGSENISLPTLFETGSQARSSTMPHRFGPGSDD